MAEEVIKTIENIDKMFAQIEVNGQVYESDRFHGASSPSVQPRNSSRQTAQGEDVEAVVLNNTQHDFRDGETLEAVEQLQEGLNTEVSMRQQDVNDLTAEVTALQQLLSTIQSRINEINVLIPSQASSSNKLTDSNGVSSAISSATNPLSSAISGIEAKIPNQASSNNKLADKEFVNSSISTNTANFLGTYTSLAQIEAISNPTNNDYAFLQTTDSAGNTEYQRYKYSSLDSQWHYEYTLNNSSFTSEQWATINSGLTQASVNQDILDAINALDVASVGGSGKYISAISETDGKINAIASDLATTVTEGNSQPVTSDAVATAIDDSAYNTKYCANGAESLDSVGWYKIAELGQRNRGLSIIIDLGRGYSYSASEAHHIVLEYGWAGIDVFECSSAITPLFDKIRLCYSNNNTDKMGIYVHYTGTRENPSYFSISGLVTSGLRGTPNIEVFNFVPDSLTWDNTKEYVLRGSGLYFNGDRLTPISTIVSGSTAPVTSGGVASYYGANKKFISWNSTGIYSSGYILLAEISHKTGGNHDVGFSGIAQICPAGTITNAYFQGFIRAGGGSVNIKQFTINYLGGGKYLYLSCFYEVTDTNNIIIRLYGNVATWLKYNVYFDSLLAGDVAEPVNPAVSNVTFPLTVTDTRAGTEIPVTVYNP